MSCRFFVGLHQPSDARHFADCFLSVNRLRRLKHPERLEVASWIMDSGAFTEVALHGGYRSSVADYASEARRWVRSGRLLAVVAQDYMCEPFVLSRTGGTVAQHQALTIERYDALLAEGVGGAYVMPVLQGYDASEYVRHVRAYGARIGQGAWVGVGSVCKRNGDPRAIERVLLAILAERPDLRLHGFGLKTTALESPLVLSWLYSADSMAWSYAARRNGRNANDWHEAAAFVQKQLGRPVQLQVFGVSECERASA